MRIALCNEVVAGLDFAAQARLAARLGYAGLEVAPFTLDAEALLRRFVPTGAIANVHLNDRNRRGPGQGGDRFAPVLRALRETGYGGFCAVEPFDYHPDGPTAAARAIGYLQGVMESL